MVKRYCWSPDGMETSGYDDIDKYVLVDDYAALRELCDELAEYVDMVDRCEMSETTQHVLARSILAKYEQFIKEQG